MKVVSLALLISQAFSQSFEFDPSKKFNPDFPEDDTQPSNPGASDNTEIVDSSAEPRGQDLDGEVTVLKTKMAIIPRGATENNEEGFYLDGDYSTIKNRYGELFLELNIQLHHDGIKQIDDGIYMIWLQVIDPLKSEEENYYEGFACSVRYDADLEEKIRSNYLFRYGYRGTRKMNYATDTWDRMLRDDRTENYAWLLQPEKTYLIMDDRNKRYGLNCNLYRDFETTYSDVPLRGKAVLNFNAGFKIWNSLKDTKPAWKGHKDNIKWLISDLSDSAFAIASLGITVAALL